MVILTFRVKPEDAPGEQAWLNEMKIYPSTESWFDWVADKRFIAFGMIVSPEAAVAIKLRHPTAHQTNYVK